MKLALLPVTYKQMESAQRLQALAPKAKELKEKYGRNKALLNQLTAKLYEDAEVNPLAGCLPALAQIPIFIALYRSLINLANNADFNEPFLWLPSLAGPLYGQQRGMDWLTANWADGVPSLGWHDTVAFLTIPVILVVTQSISQRMLSPPTPDDPKAAQTQRILKYLPFMVGYFSLSVPAGLGLYWITNNLISTSISLAIKVRLSLSLDSQLVSLALIHQVTCSNPHPQCNATPVTHTTILAPHAHRRSSTRTPSSSTWRWTPRTWATTRPPSPSPSRSCWTRPPATPSPRASPSAGGLRPRRSWRRRAGWPLVLLLGGRSCCMWRRRRRRRRRGRRRGWMPKEVVAVLVSSSSESHARDRRKEEKGGGVSSDAVGVSGLCNVHTYISNQKRKLDEGKETRTGCDSLYARRSAQAKKRENARERE